MKRIYLDHAAATPIDSKILRVVADTLKKYPGNPSAIHSEGRRAHAALEEARREIAENLSAHPDEVVFTSGATEADNLAILGVVHAARARGITNPHIIISAIEHPAILEAVRSLESDFGIKADVLNVDGNGLIDTRELRKIIKPETVLVSIMYANNEIGTVEPITYIAKEIRHARKMNSSQYPYFHTDASQASNYLDINVLRLGVDLMTLSSSKTYGPRGVGALFIKRGVNVSPIMHGGKHESGRRPGTESPALAIGFAKALTMAQSTSEKEARRIQKLRDLLSGKILDKIPGASLNSSSINSLPNIVNISFTGLESDSLVLYLDARGIAVSGQSACKSSEDGPSHVIMAIGKVGDAASGSIRFSLGRSTTRENILRVVAELSNSISLLREAQSQSDIV
jgi:cysteine desulfurase